VVLGVRTWILALCANGAKKTSKTNKEIQLEPKTLAQMSIPTRLIFYGNFISAFGLRHTLANQGCASNGRPAGR
jgi:hypothetical protein